ncbi:micro-fibrillar-associated protein 1 containing protein [Aphelenchoides avenae]|nr:micro-fibrillar-associated protein 1 containing protein [Aphelenchus avenae]
MTVDNEFDGDLHGQDGIIRASSSEECSVSFEDLCAERLIPWAFLLPVEPKEGDLARIITGAHIGLTGTVESVDDEEVAVHLKHGVVVCRIGDLCKVR